jgi:addiction module HigA family antidote
MTKRLNPIHPGKVLKELFLKPMKLTAYRVAKGTGMPQTQIGEILRGQRSITAEAALLLAAFFGTSATVWVRLQGEYDLRIAHRKMAYRLKQVDTGFMQQHAESMASA